MKEERAKEILEELGWQGINKSNPADLCRECELASKTRELEQAGDRMAKRLCLIINSERTPDNASIDAVKSWWKAKEESE